MQFKIVNKINKQIYFKEISTIEDLTSIIEYNKVSIEASVTQAVATLANPPVIQPPLPWATVTA